MKRLIDVLLSALGLLFTAPLQVIIYLWIRADSAGPAIFRQTRVGRRGQTFRMHKFRTMRIDASGPLVTGSFDPRVTRVGRVLRSTKLDELPQLIDVLSGKMSLVGRAERCRIREPGRRRPANAISVRPGTTDPASIEYTTRPRRLLGECAGRRGCHLWTVLPLRSRSTLTTSRTARFVENVLIVLRPSAAVVGREPRTALMTIGLVSQWYAPEPGPAALPSDLAEALARRGHVMSVVTGVPNYPTGHVLDGYRIRPMQDE